MATTESSVLTSLMNLARIEEQRVREERAVRTRAELDLARAEAQRADERRRLEDDRTAAEAARHAKHQAADAEARLRIEARERAAIDVARIQAASQARLEVDNAVRAHELAVLQTRAGRFSGRLFALGAVALAMLLSGGAWGAYAASARITGAEREADQLRATVRMLTDERETLAAVDRAHSAPHVDQTVRPTSGAPATTVTSRPPLPPAPPVPRAHLTPPPAPAPSECRAGDPICGLKVQPL